MELINYSVPCIFVGEALCTLHFFSGSAIPTYLDILEKVLQKLYSSCTDGTLGPVLTKMIDKSQFVNEINGIVDEYNLFDKMKKFIDTSV